MVYKQKKGGKMSKVAEGREFLWREGKMKEKSTSYLPRILYSKKDREKALFNFLWRFFGSIG